ncbi:hypothetical protein MtrunA17_Chr3g0103661 [Medicago truncatula]|uniref:Uncharacterized protein n=1 Tax=Medicago truncatula TaxID=3880 RepID=A0A072V7I5_MEDTR|nr:uncharacterized protein LOC25490755 [Medicago truncatula]XP_024634053.1 uncharacterized protein LOC25490755 [Medicago truncatula]KEH34140.1 hypothetical protein MTR_3g462090 [Medicago truncatula]KEH34142.1 hypothetical protein MTR_3g462110 [Medicago truncatula]RHN67529.1 hypothetical protein MtrunA17_Chr3g0103661 [Medicago truncatula]
MDVESADVFASQDPQPQEQSELFQGQGEGLQQIITNALIHLAPAIAEVIVAGFPPQYQYQQIAGNQHDPAMLNGDGGADLDLFVMTNDPFKHMWYAHGSDGSPGPDPNVFHDLGLFGDGFDAVFAIAVQNYNLGRFFAGMRKS